MANFVLVHGAWHGSWCWKRVRRALRDQGHEVFTPSLSGVGERSHLLSREIDLQTHVADVANLIRWEELTDVVLCGHSYGGCVITGVAEAVPERIAALVYLDAFVLQNGQCLHDTLPPEVRQAQLDAAGQFGDGWKVPPIPAEAFAVNAQDSAWVDRQCTFQPLETFRQKLAVTGASRGIADISFILASGFVQSPFPPFFEAARARGWRTTIMDCGHDVMLDMPGELTAELATVARKLPGATSHVETMTIPAV